MESDGEIEYLDEDAEIVQQYVQPLEQDITTKGERRPPLLVERSKAKKRKPKKQEDSSDYDPNDDSPPGSPGPLKKKRQTRKSKIMSTPVKVTPKTPVRSKTYSEFFSLGLNRKKMDIRIPDYDDPLCMPVRALRSVSSDLQRLKSWNNACLEHFKQCDTLLKPENGQTKSSSRTIILRNMTHKETGKPEIAVWSKTCVTNTIGLKKSEIFQSILPKYKEKKVLRQYDLMPMIRTRKVHHDEVILTKEQNKDSEMLVVYRPSDSLSAVYKFMKNEESREQNPDEDDKPKRVLKEVASCKVCAPCYQTSWRSSKHSNSNTKLTCPMCGRGIGSVYNFLTHLKGHNKAQIKMNKRKISAMLAGILEYHYKCRVCQKKFATIKALRQHVPSHKVAVTFRCEVGNHMTR